MNQTTIRIAKNEDAEAIGRVHIQSWQKAYENYIPEDILNNLSLIEHAQLWRNLIEKGVEVLVLERDNQVVGFASICLFRGDGFSKSGEISAIYLSPQYWRNGYGTQLCLAAIDRLANAGYKDVLLWVLIDNTSAKHFYENLGFKATDDTKLEEFYQGGSLLEEMLYRKEGIQAANCH